jgi:hypothetical protein
LGGATPKNITITTITTHIGDIITMIKRISLGIHGCEDNAEEEKKWATRTRDGTTDKTQKTEGIITITICLYTGSAITEVATKLATNIMGSFVVQIRNLGLNATAHGVGEPRTHA